MDRYEYNMVPYLSVLNYDLNKAITTKTMSFSLTKTVSSYSVMDFKLVNRIRTQFCWNIMLDEQFVLEDNMVEQ